MGGTGYEVPAFAVASVDDIFDAGTRRALAHLMPVYLPARRWFLGKNRVIRSTEVIEILSLPHTSAHLLFLQVGYTDGDPEIYLLALSVAMGEKARRILHTMPEYVLARLECEDGNEGVLYTAAQDREFSQLLLNAVARRRKFRGESGELVAAHTRSFRKEWSGGDRGLEPVGLSADQSNSSIVYGDRLILKIFRRLEPGINPDAEMQTFLGEKAGFPNTSVCLGTLEYRQEEREPFTVAVLKNYVRSEENGWTYTIDQLGLFFERALALPPNDSRMRELAAFEAPGSKTATWRAACWWSCSAPISTTYALLGLAHRRVASGTGQPAGHPGIRSRALHRLLPAQPLSRLARASEPLLRAAAGEPRLASRGHAGAKPANRCAGSRKCAAASRCCATTASPATRIRHHGNYHLGEVLYTGRTSSSSTSKATRAAR